MHSRIIEFMHLCITEFMYLPTVVFWNDFCGGKLRNLFVLQTPVDVLLSVIYSL